VQDLQGHVPLELEVAGAVDGPEASGPGVLEQVVTGDHGRRGGGDLHVAEEPLEGVAAGAGFHGRSSGSPVDLRGEPFTIGERSRAGEGDGGFLIGREGW
jgi:hypothetical protein